MSGPWGRADWTKGPTEPGRPEGMEARLAVMDRALHHEDGTHRLGAPTANGRDVERFETRMRAHRADGHEHEPGQGRLLDEENVPLALPNRPEVQLSRGALDTAARAAQLALPRSGTQRMRVLRCIAMLTDSAGGGVTDSELETELHLSGNSVRPRRLELVEQGWVEDSGRRRKPYAWAGEYAVWRLTEAGRQAYWEADRRGETGG